MNTALRTIITSHKPAVPSWLKPNLVCYWEGAKRAGVYYPMTNLVANGNFEDGTTGWNGAIGTVADGVYVHPAAAQALYQSITIINGHQYYLSIRYKVDGYSRAIYLKNGSTSVSSAFPLNLYTSDFGISSTIFTATGDGDRISYNPMNYNFDLYVDYVMVFNLTATFGAGNEPTAAEMDAILAADGTPYWDGTRNVLCNPNGKYFWADQSGNNRHMKMSNLAYIGNSNLDGSGFNVDGVDDYGSIPDSPETRLTQGGTLCAWIKPRTAGETAGRIFSKSIDTNTLGGYNFKFSSDGALSLGISNLTGTVSKAGVVKMNVWQFVVAIIAATGKYFDYNGASLELAGTTGNQSALPTNTAAAVYIGNNYSTDRTFDGQIDRPMIINRALTQAEIQYLFEATRKYYGV